MRTIETKVCEYEELSDPAKAKARDWYRGCAGMDYEWWDCVYDDFIEITKILGVELSERKGGGYRLDKDGKKVPVCEPEIYFAGFWSQGDGASWAGRYRYAPGWRKKLLAYCNDKELLRIGEELQEIQRKHMYQLEASVIQRGRCCHEYTMDIEWTQRLDEKRIDKEHRVRGELLETLRDLARWLYKSLAREYDYLNSDEVVEELIVANEYEFTEDGELA